MIVDPKEESAGKIYDLFAGCVVPRPIAWVSTIGKDGVLNLAPFSFFMGVAVDPPLLAISVVHMGEKIQKRLQNLPPS